MKKLLSAAAALAVLSGGAQAAIIGVNETLGASSMGTNAAIIGAPSDALDDLVTNTGMEGFNEAQAVLLGAGGVQTDQGFVGQNMVVDSHMIFLNSQGTAPLSHFGVEWTFSGMILGVMSDSSGNLEANSTALLGAAGTNYTVGPGAAPFSARGMENNNGGLGPWPNDGYMINGNVLTVGMSVTEPGDWIRVVTVNVVPVPAALPLLLAGIGGLGLFARRRKTT